MAVRRRCIVCPRPYCCVCGVGVKEGIRGGGAVGRWCGGESRFRRHERVVIPGRPARGTVLWLI
jgi:hypothetical protein